MKKTACLVLLGFMVILLAGCMVAKPTFAPPPLKKEMRPRQPGPGYVWITGHWNWNGIRYSWASGHWVKKRQGRTWAAGHWEKRGQHWVWIRGRWR